MFLISCSKQKVDKHKTYNDGWYEWKILPSKNNLKDSIYVSIEVMDKDNPNLLMYTTLKYGCDSFKLKKGVNTFKMSRSTVKTQFRVISLGYFSIETRPYLFAENDSLAVKFYLAEDDRMLINCE